MNGNDLVRATTSGVPEKITVYGSGESRQVAGEVGYTVETDEVNPSTNQRRRMSYSTRVLEGNHALEQ